MLIDNVSHEWLFRHVKAVSHHGGAGTTAAGIRAGVPSVIVPFGGDQPYWGDRIYKLGLGTKPIWYKRMTVENYSKAIDIAVSDGVMQKRAIEYGKKLRVEDGVSNAMRYTQYRGLAQVTNWVKLKYAAMNLKKLSKWKWRTSLPCLLVQIFTQECAEHLVCYAT